MKSSSCGSQQVGTTAGPIHYNDKSLAAICTASNYLWLSLLDADKGRPARVIAGCADSCKTDVAASDLSLW